MYVDDNPALNFVYECFVAYFSGRKLLMLLFAFFIFSVLYLWRTGSKIEKNIFVYPQVVLFLTVYNPLLAPKLVEIFHIESRYYRFFWLLPVGITAVYFVIKILSKCQETVRRILLAVIAVAVIFLIFKGKNLGVAQMPSNIYKVDQDILDMSSIINEDRHESQSEVMMNVPLVYYLHAYDPSINSYFSRYNIMQPKENAQITAVSTNEEARLVLQGAFFYGISYDDNLLKEALAMEGIDYIIVGASDETKINIFGEADCTAIGNTENYIVYKISET